MWIDPITLHNKSRLISDYMKSDNKILSGFDYSPYNSMTYKQRIADLKERQFDREDLTNVLLKLNKEWEAPTSTLHNIERLKDNESVVVIGGQQAGLLTGPLYTINKIISIIHLAKQQENELNVPVIPVFWIAGEDHDFDEINHVMVQRQARMKKFKVKQQVNKKFSVSALELDKQEATQWMQGIFKELPETQHTKGLYSLLEKELTKSKTYVDFFARIILKLFKRDGLVLVDSGDPLVRKLESKHFVRIIQNQRAISEGVYRKLQQVKSSGYAVSVDVEGDDAHLFYHKDGERVLLVRTEDNKWRGKQNECEFSTDELIQIAENTPELLSNNVVTRPFMQECLFPSLAFLGGPGEVGYWSILKPLFQSMEIKMPPVLPRLSFTLINEKVQRKLNKFSIESMYAVNHGVDLERGNWLSSQISPSIEQLTDQVKFSVERAHKPLKELAQSMGPDLGDMAEKNLLFLFEDVDFLGERIQSALERKHASALTDFDHIQAYVHPEGGLQERCWNVITFLNEYGYDLIETMIDQPYDYTQDHYLLYL